MREAPAATVPAVAYSPTVGDDFVAWLAPAPWILVRFISTGDILELRRSHDRLAERLGRVRGREPVGPVSMEIRWSGATAVAVGVLLILVGDGEGEGGDAIGAAPSGAQGASVGWRF